VRTFFSTQLGRSSQTRQIRVGALLYYLALSLFVAVLCAGRLVLIRNLVGAQPLLRMLFIDLCVALFIALLARLLQRIHISAAASLLILVSLLHIANLEMAIARNTYIHLADLRYAASVHFIKGSLLHLTCPWYAFCVFLSTALHIVALANIGKNGPLKTKYLLPSLFLSLLSVSLLSPKQGEWHSSNLLLRSITHSLPRVGSSVLHKSESDSSIDLPGLNQADWQHGNKLYFRKTPGTKRNVLFIVLEGIPGVYLKQVQEWTGVEYPIQMPALSRIAERSLIVPNFVTHNRQTIRGLYSLLSGDYCKLSLTTPKIYEYNRLAPESRSPCLPEILVQEGYTTAYLQAADLAYMSKDRFMPEAGFQRVVGKEYFQYQHVPFGWGPDDKAFFEQAADFIEQLNREVNPWFVTLLTVGTHHPGAVSEDWAAQFSNRREAAVAYLDRALGAFVQRLEQGGILDDTLVLFTSDESHGVTGQPYGRFWGLAVACAPESYGVVNPGVYGLIDIPFSVLDYLDLTDRAFSFPRRSILREQRTERPILFESYLCEQKGIVKKRIDNRRVEVFRSENGELFAQTYETDIVTGEAGQKLSEEHLRYQIAADSSLYDSERKDREYVLLENDEFILEGSKGKVLSTGQYLDIPGGTTVTVVLKATTELADGYNTQENREAIKLVLQLQKWYKKMQIPEINIPVLKDNELLELSFSFYTPDPLTRVWAYLSARSAHPSRKAKLRIIRFSMETKECKTESDFIIHYLLIKEKTGSQQWNRETDPRVNRNYHWHCENLLFPGGESYGSGKSLLWPVQYDANVQSGGSWVVVRFSAGRVDSRYDQYLISFHLKALKPGFLSEQEISVSLNDYPVACMWFEHDPREKEATLLFSRKLLKENDTNIIRLKMDEPIPSTEPSPPGPPLHHDRESGDFDLLDLVLRPSLPPVAHAGGGYRGLTYTNSIEALRENAGTFTFFEIDFEWTKDEQLVCLHDWGETFAWLFGFKTEEPLQLDTFRELKTVFGITPLTLTSLKKFLLDNPSARIITDIKSNNIRALRELAGQLPDVIGRIIPQIYQPEEFKKAVELGYQDIIWTLYRYPYKYDLVEVLSLIQQWEEEYGRKPFGIVMPVPVVEKGVAKIVVEAGIPVYVHTINTCADYRRLLQLGVSSVYTDLLDIGTCYATSAPCLHSSCQICLLP